MDFRKKMKRAISMLTAVLMVISMLTVNIAYASIAPVNPVETLGVKNMVKMGSSSRVKGSYTYASYSYNTIPGDSGPVYRNVDGMSWEEGGTWTRREKDGVITVHPGKSDDASMGFVVDLVGHNMLGAALKGDLKAINETRYKNYILDKDYGQPHISFYKIDGAKINTVAGDEKDFDDYAINTKEADVDKLTAYIIFSIYAKRKASAANDLDIFLEYIKGVITDNKAPNFVSATNDCNADGSPLQLSQYDEVIKQNINAQEPNIYITMDEDCTFPININATLYATDGSEVGTNLIYMGRSHINYSNGNMTYKFRINVEDLQNRGIFKHFYEMEIKNFYAEDTFLNPIIANTTPIKFKKRIDTKAPIIETDYMLSPPNMFLVDDEFGLSSVKYDMTINGVTNSKVLVQEPKTTKVGMSTKDIIFSIENTTKYSGEFDIEISASDLVNDTNTERQKYNSFKLKKKLFLISNQDALGFSLKNSNNPMLKLEESNVSSTTTNALTNMYFESSLKLKDITKDIIYYKWSGTYDESILTQVDLSPENGWNQVKFKAAENRTEEISVPVAMKIDDKGGSYLAPVYKDGGYLYIIPKIKDDTADEAKIRTGSMAKNYKSEESYDENKNKGYFKLSSNPVEGNFENRGCDCTGQGTGVDGILHYSSYGNHKKDIGFDVTNNNEELASLKYYISEGIGADKSSSYIAQGSFAKNSTGKYDVPINSIINKTGEYTITVVLYSGKGDITVNNLDIRIENPIVSITDVLYNQATKDFDFTLKYSKNSFVDKALTDIQIEFAAEDIVKFTEKNGETENKISIYAISEDAVIPKDNWSTSDKAFVRTEFYQDAANENLMVANFRASLTNMEKAGDAFIKAAGEKRVHLKYTSSNKVEIYNNNLSVIKKANLPPSINNTGNTSLLGEYLKSSEFNTGTVPIISIDIEEPIVDLVKVNYAWVESADTSLITDDGSIAGISVGLSGTDKINISPRDIPSIATTDSELYKPYFLIVYAENSAGKYIERSFGPFYVLNEDIDNKRFEITVTDEAISEEHVFIAVDDRLHMITELDKADKVKLKWNKNDIEIVKTYDICFEKGEDTSNLAYINIPYIDLTDTNGVGGTFKLSSVEIINSGKPTVSIKAKTINEADIKQVLPEHFVSINMIGDKDNYSGANVKSDIDDIQYSWSSNQYDNPSVWTAISGVSSELGKSFYPIENKSLINTRNYLFLKIRDSIYRTDEIKLQDPDTLAEVTAASIKIGAAEDGYLGAENGAQANVMLRIKVDNAQDLSKINQIKCFDLYSGASSGTAISVNNVYKISDNEIAAFIPSLVTSSGAISCTVSINDFTALEVKSNRVGDLSPVDLSITRDNRTITLTNKADYLKYSLYQSDGSKYTFNDEGKTKIFENGKYLLVYRDSTNNYMYTKVIEVSGITYTSADISKTLTAIETEGKVTNVNIEITMPLGSMIIDKYGILNNVVVNKENKTVVATSVVTNSAIYAFDIKLADSTVIKDYKIDVTSIVQNYIPESTEGAAANIKYSPEEKTLTNQDVTATITDANALLSNNATNSVTFNKSGSYSLAFMDNEAVNKVKIYTAVIDWIDKSCPEPVIKKYVWYDFDNDGIIDDGEKGAEISQGYKTKNNVLVEIEFSKESRAVKLSDDTGFIITEPADNDYAYKFTYVYNPAKSLGDTPVFRKMLEFSDTLGNTLKYNFVIDEIDRTALLTQLNYSTTNYTNRDVVVSMAANKAIKRFDIVQDAEGKDVEKEASPTYIFKENGSKDFNYREIQTDDPIEGTLVANVTWIDKNAPVVKVSYDNTLTNQDVEIRLTVVNGGGLKENARLKYGDKIIALTDSGDDRIGTHTVSENGNYSFTVINKYGNTGSVIIPINCIDKKAPELSITGRTIVYVKAGDKYYDKGATAIDNRDGTITAAIKSTSNVDTSAEGTYEVVYTVSDNAGNTSLKTRTVRVLDINSAVAIVQDNVIDLKSTVVHQIALSESGIVFMELVGINGNYVTKYAKGEGFDNAYFKTNGSYLSKLGTFTAEKGKYTLYIQDQERNTRIITVEFK